MSAAGVSTAPVTAASPLQLWARSRSAGAWLAVGAFAAICLYVFWLTPYQQFLFSDMKNFWTQAMQRLDGREFADSQFVAWPPLYHIFLAELFRILRVLGLGELVRLETALLLNITVFAASVFALQRLAAHWLQRGDMVLLCTLLYGFGFPALYFNAFLLADNLGSPLLVMAVAAIVCVPGWRGILLSAMLFAAATIVRPALGPYGLAFVAFLLARQGWSRRFLLQAALFSALFFSLIALASLEVSRISKGRVNGLSANGGLDFFIANTDYHRVDLSYDGWHFFVIVPAQSWRPENGVFYTNVPFYEQGHYFKLGWEALARDPIRMVRNLSEIRNLFFADMLPSRYDAPGFKWLRPVWDWFKFIMFLSCGLYLWRWRSLGERRPVVVLLGSLILLTMVVSVLFTGEPRYTYAIIFAFYLLSLHLLEDGLAGWRSWRRPLALYATALGVAGGVGWGSVAAMTPRLPERVELSLIPQRDALDVKPALISRVVFPHTRGEGDLRHQDSAEVALGEPGLMRLRTRLEVLGETSLQLVMRAYSAWSIALLVDNEPIMVHESPDFFRDAESVLNLSPGLHELELQVNYLHTPGGLALNYMYQDEDGWQVRRTVGMDSPRVRFHLPQQVPQVGAKP